MTTEILTQTITLTSAAARALQNMFQERNLDNSHSLRLYIAGRSCSGFQYGMSLDNETHETDTIFESEGIKIIIDEQSKLYMTGCTVDYIDNDQAKGFLIENPNQTPSCSCDSGGCSS